MKIKAMTLTELWRLARRMQNDGWFFGGAFGDSDPLCFGEEPDGDDDAKSWWGMLPVSHFDDDTWLVGHFGGGNTIAVEITDLENETDKEELFVEAVRKAIEAGNGPQEEGDVVYVDLEAVPTKYLTGSVPIVGVDWSEFGREDGE